MVGIVDISIRGLGCTTGNRFLLCDTAITYTPRPDGLEEGFLYDDLRRVTLFGNFGTLLQTASYDNLGNITAKTGAGNLKYDNTTRPYQVTEQRNLPATLDTDQLNVTYTSGERPATISKSGHTATFSYNHAGERTKMAVSGATANYTRTYLGGNYEHEVNGSNTTEWLYLGGTPYTAPVALYRINNSVWAPLNIHRDHLGSVAAVSNVISSTTYSYDAWGQLRDPLTHQLYAHNAQPELLLRRGYTGHEHLREFGLINMNARLYNPVIGRFLSPDPYVPDWTYSQDFNRYMYARNNPLIYTDPSGEIVWLVPALVTIGKAILVGAATGAVVGGATYAVAAGVSGNWNTGDFWKSVGFGAVGGAIGGGFSGLGAVGAFGQFGNSFAYGMLSQTSTSVVTNAIYGNNITLGSVVGGMAGSFLSASMPSFSGVQGGLFKNAIAEVGFSMAKGAYVGAFSGAIGGAIDGNPNGMIQGMVGGAISGGSGALLRIGLMGPTFIPDAEYYCDMGNYGQVHRTGALLRGIAIGNNAVGLESRSGKYSFDQIREARHHEGYHVKQMNEMGTFGFYSKIASQWIGATLSWGDRMAVYHSNFQGVHSLERAARFYTWQKLGYYFYGNEIRYGNWF